MVVIILPIFHVHRAQLPNQQCPHRTQLSDHLAYKTGMCNTQCSLHSSFNCMHFSTKSRNKLLHSVYRTWSSGRSISDGWPDSTPDSESKDWPSSQQSPAAAFTDLVPEFEPGKPWKVSESCVHACECACMRARTQINHLQSRQLLLPNSRDRR